MTQEVGTVSGELDVAVDDKGYGLVRYRGTDTWYTIGNLEATEPCTWSGCDELVSAIMAVAGTRDAAGNTIPFEARKDDAADEPAASDDSAAATEEPAATGEPTVAAEKTAGEEGSAPADEPTTPEDEPVTATEKSPTAPEEPAASSAQPSPATDESKPPPEPDSAQPASSTEPPEQKPLANRPEANTGTTGALQRLLRKLRKPW